MQILEDVRVVVRVLSIMSTYLENLWSRNNGPAPLCHPYSFAVFCKLVRHSRREPLKIKMSNRTNRSGIRKREEGRQRREGEEGGE